MTFRSKISLAALASLALFACSTSTGTNGTNEEEPAKDEAEVQFEESEMRACSETYARKFFLALDGRACADIEGRRGKWVATALDDSSESVCSVEWSGEKYSRADMDALRAFVKETDAFTAACGSASTVGDGYLTPIPELDVLAQIGANGCDVCGKLRRDGKIIVVLPPFITSTRQFEIPLSDGTHQAFQIEAPEGARAVAVQLPELPEGVTYAASHVTVY